MHEAKTTPLEQAFAGTQITINHLRRRANFLRSSTQTLTQAHLDAATRLECALTIAKRKEK